MPSCALLHSEHTRGSSPRGLDVEISSVAEDGAAGELTFGNADQAGEKIISAKQIWGTDTRNLKDASRRPQNELQRFGILVAAECRPFIPFYRQSVPFT